MGFQAIHARDFGELPVPLLQCSLNLNFSSRMKMTPEIEWGWVVRFPQYSQVP